MRNPIDIKEQIKEFAEDRNLEYVYSNDSKIIFKEFNRKK